MKVKKEEGKKGKERKKVKNVSRHEKQLPVNTLGKNPEKSAAGWGANLINPNLRG